jgi:hypothetical protein
MSSPSGIIVEAQSTDKPPLLYYRSAFRDLGERSLKSLWTLSADDPHGGWFDANTSFVPIAHLQAGPLS